MKKVACAVLIFAMVIFLVNPLSSDAGRGSSRSSHSRSGHSSSSHSSVYHGSSHYGSGYQSNGYYGSRYHGIGHHGSGYYSSGYHGSRYHGSGHHGSGYYWSGGYWGWWAPWSVYAGVAIWDPYYSYPYPYYYPYAYNYYLPYHIPPLTVDQEPLVYAEPAPSVPPPISGKILIYPRKGQNKELQESDRYECHRWGVSQTGYDPTQTTNDMPQNQLTQVRADYFRAMSACLNARGYTIK